MAPEIQIALAIGVSLALWGPLLWISSQPLRERRRQRR